MIKSISLNFKKTVVDFLFFQYDNEINVYGKTRLHKHINFEIHFALNGFYEYEFIDRKILLQKNHMLIIPPGTVHKSVDISNAEYEFKVLTLKFSSEEDDDGFYAFFTSAFQRRALDNIELQKEMIDSILNLYSAIDGKSYLQSVYLHSCASKVIYKLCDLLSDDKDKYLPESGEYLEVQIENMVNNFNMSLSDIANTINYSPRQTERIIKQIYGKSLTKIREDFK